MYKEVDDAINDSLKKFARVSRLSLKKISLSDLHVLDKEAALEMQDKIVHAIDHCEDKKALIQNIRDRSNYAHIVVPFMDYYVKKQKIPSVKRPDIVSGTKINKDYRFLAPFLLTGMMPDKLKLIGFENSEKAKLWFSCSEEVPGGFIYIGNNGESRKILDSKIEELGYSRIENSGKELRDICQSELKKEFGAKEIKEVGFYLGKVTIPRSEKDSAMRKLSEFIDNSIRKSFTPSPSIK